MRQGLDQGQREAVAEFVARLKHDLGKYIALQQRWLPQAATAEERNEALRRDLLATRSGPDGQQTAHEVWQPFARVLAGQEELVGAGCWDWRGDGDVQALFQAMERLDALVLRLQVRDLDTADQEQAGEACFEVAAACTRLARKIRATTAVDPMGD